MVGLIHNGENRYFAGNEFADIGSSAAVAQRRSLITGILRCQDNNRKLIIHQRCWSMLELTSRVAFGMDVGNLFELQRAFQGNGIVNVAPDEDEVLVFVELRSVFAARFVCGKCRLDMIRQIFQVIEREALRGAQRSTHLREVSRKQKQSRQLSREALGCGNGYLLTGMGQKGGIRKPRKRRFWHIANGKRASMF